MFGRNSGFEVYEQRLEQEVRSEFQEIWRRGADELHTLAFLLTANQMRARQCFVAGLEESIAGNPAFRDWARAWSKRLIIRNAIKMMAPAPGQTNRMPVKRESHENSSSRDALLGSVLELHPFERFVFVIRVLEGHSLGDSAGLLGCTFAELTRAHSRALRQIAARNALADPNECHQIARPRFVLRPESA